MHLNFTAVSLSILAQLPTDDNFFPHQTILQKRSTDQKLTRAI